MTKMIHIRTVRLRSPKADDRRTCDQLLMDALGPDHPSIPLPALRKAAAEVKAGASTLTCVVGRRGRESVLIDIGDVRSYSLALDLGTTNLVALLFDNRSGRTVLTRSFENPQIAFGADILTRMHSAMPGSGGKVYGVLSSGINQAIRTLCAEAGIAPSDLHAMVVAGNTVMTHFFLGLDISTIPVAPFVPVVKKPGFIRSGDLGLELNQEALVYVFPNAGSYVGGDIVAGILAAGIHRSAQPRVLIDVGTNAEVVIGTRDWMLVGAGAAGPALEEGVCRIGRRAQRGIIYDVELSAAGISCKTFDEQSPEGICGSGMVSLLHALYQAGVVDSSGTLREQAPNVVTADGEKAFSIDCAGNGPLVIRQSEIRNFMKSKAAMFTLLLVLVRELGIRFKDVTRVSVSGALGTGIDARKAVAIGMLPAWKPEIVHALGNTSLEGARMLLENHDLLAVIDEVLGKITYKHMHDDPEFMKEFLGAVFIPHTNPELLRAE